MNKRAIIIVIWTLAAIAVTAVLTWVHWRWPGTDRVLGVIGSYASLVGLAITAYVSISVAKIKGRLISRFMLDSCMAEFERLRGRFEQASTAEDFKKLSAEVLEYVTQISEVMPKNSNVESPAAALQELLKCSNGSRVIAMGRDLRIQLIQFNTQVQIHRTKEGLGRDDG